MALPTGLIPTLVFVITVGISVPVMVAAHRFHRTGTDDFRTALAGALFEAGLLYILGVGVVWSIAGGGIDTELWEIPAALLATGVATLFLFVALPLWIGERLVTRLRDTEPATAFRFTAYGWPVAMLFVFGIFVAPGGVFGGDLLSLGGPRTCLAGVCGISLMLAGAVLLEMLVAVVGPGLVGALLLSQTRWT
jgi:fumarate reductase subunit D